MTTSKESMTILGVGGEEARAIATEIVDRWSRGEGPLHEAITAAILRARREGTEEMQKLACKTAFDFRDGNPQAWDSVETTAARIADVIRSLPLS